MITTLPSSDIVASPFSVRIGLRYGSRACVCFNPHPVSRPGATAPHSASHWAYVLSTSRHSCSLRGVQRAASEGHRPAAAAEVPDHHTTGAKPVTKVHLSATPQVLERIVMEAQDAIILADRDGVIRVWNAGAEVMFGHSAEEAIGRTLDLIIPERLRPRHWEGYTRVMQTGVTRYGRELLAVPGVRKDGARISLEFSITILKDDAGAISGIAAILRDVTTRFEQDRALRQRLAGLEAQIKNAELPPADA
ncbi:MAG: PAS domain S-box protein [Chloroflexi bacterium]|nr:PAS domain S-box protein [Chloroflexota bacterium]